MFLIEYYNIQKITMVLYIKVHISATRAASVFYR